MTKLIVGLGNPGVRYSKTRHNLGRVIVENLAREEGVALKSRFRLNAATGAWDREGDEVILSYPSTYMNLSGQAVCKLVRYFGIDVSTGLLIVVDEMALPFGKLRLRARGSHAGHNGLKSIQELLDSSAYPRLRAGVGHPRESYGEAVDPAEYLLSRFLPEEIQQLPGVIKTGAEACRIWIKNPIERAMSVVNESPATS